MNAPELKLAARVREGLPYPRGATWDGKGVNFASVLRQRHQGRGLPVRSARQTETERIELPEYRDEIWHGYVPDLGPGTVYGYRVHGPYEPEEGHRFNPEQAAARPVRARAHRRAEMGPGGVRLQGRRPQATTCRSTSATARPSCRSAWWSIRTSTGSARKSGARCRGTAPSSTRRTCAATPSCIRRCPSTSAARSPASRHKEVIDYIKSLGVTTVELLPIHTFVNDSFLLEREAHQLLGLQLHRLLRARSALRRRPGEDACRNSRRWWRASTTRASK